MFHGDIKPQNIFMSCSPLPTDTSTSGIATTSLKLADFGLATSMFDSSHVVHRQQCVHEGGCVEGHGVVYVS